MTTPQKDRISRVEVGLLSLVAFCALLLVLLVVRRELQPLASAKERHRDLETIEDPKSYYGRGHRLGADTAPVVAVVFSDYQCKYCRALNNDLRRIVVESHGGVAVIFRHFPLEDIHDNALTAALASECAADQGRFSDMHELLFVVSDTLDRIAVSDLAARAGVPREAAFATCVESKIHVSRVAQDVSAGRRLKVGATPTWIIGNRVIRGAVVGDSLTRIVDEVRRSSLVPERRNPAT